MLLILFEKSVSRIQDLLVKITTELAIKISGVLNGSTDGSVHI